MHRFSLLPVAAFALTACQDAVAPRAERRP